jgi:hypothetical protein
MVSLLFTLTGIGVLVTERIMIHERKVAVLVMMLNFIFIFIRGFLLLLL